MENVYRRLQQKLHTMGLGFPATESGHELRYLPELFTEEEAEFAIKMPMGLRTAEEFAKEMELLEEDVAEQLEAMAAHNLVLRVREGDTKKYYLLPVIHGFLEFNLDRFNPTIARFFSKHYVEGMGDRFFGNDHPIFRILPVRKDLVVKDEILEIDDWEAILRRQDKIAIAECFCRLSANTHPKATGCKKNPNFKEVCISLGIFAEFYVENGNARYITLDEALEHMRRCDEEGNVVEVLNSKNVEVMCSCCDCCCGVIKALVKFGGPAAGSVSNYKIQFDEERCIKCGRCGERCLTKAVKLDSDHVILDLDQCIGCGLCASTCPDHALRLFRKPEEEIYTSPTDTVLEMYDMVRDIRMANNEF